MRNNIRHANDHFKVKCTDCETTIAEGKTISRLFKDLFKQLNYHNHDTDSKLCEESKEELKMTDLEAAFNKKQLNVLIPQDFEVQAVKHVSDEKLLGDLM